MASIRLFGRGKNTAAAGGPAVGAALIADVLESLAAASMSTTWRCRHGAGASIGEGAVDFAAGRSRSTVIRGKYAFEYVRSGANVYRARVDDMDDDAVQVRAEAAGADAARSAQVSQSVIEDGEDDVEADDELEGATEVDEVEGDGDVGGGEDEVDDEDGDDGDGDGDVALEAEEADGDDDSEFEAEADDDEPGEAEDADEQDGGQVAADGLSAAATVWERFSDHDACGVHAYAEPAVLAAGVRAAGVVQQREAQEFDGVMLSAYAVTVKPKPGDPNRVLARLARQLRDHGANVLVVTAFADESQRVEQVGRDGDEAEDSDSDADGDGGVPRIVRLRIELPHWTPADDPTADHSVSVDLFEFGERVSVQVPEDATRRKARSCADLALF